MIKLYLISGYRGIINSTVHIQNGGAVMMIFDKKVITQEDVDELNKLLSQPEFDTLRKATRKILGDEVDEKELERKFQSLRKKLNRCGYKKNSETNLYESNSQEKNINTENDENKNKNKEIKIKKPRRTKSQIKEEELKKEFEGKVKVNPILFYSKTGTEIYETLIKTQNEDIKWTGAYLVEEVTEVFKVVECGCQVIDTYKLIDASIQLAYLNRLNLKNHDFNHDFYDLLAQNKLNGGKKKQLNLELSDTAVKCLDSMLSGYFAMFNKSQLINYCMFVTAKSAKNSCFKDVEIIDLKQRKKNRIDKKITGRKKTTEQKNEENESKNNEVVESN